MKVEEKMPPRKETRNKNRIGVNTHSQSVKDKEKNNRRKRVKELTQSIHDIF